MPFLSDAYGFLRLAYGLRAFLREPISVEAAKAIVRQGMESRDIAFLQKVEQAIFANPRSPYLALFRNAGCEQGDVRALLKQEGVEGALQRLLQAGIYVTFEEFKGRRAAKANRKQTAIKAQMRPDGTRTAVLFDCCSYLCPSEATGHLSPGPC